MSDTWNDILAVKSKTSSLKEKLARRKKERENLVAGVTGSPASGAPGVPGSSTQGAGGGVAAQGAAADTQSPALKTSDKTSDSTSATQSAPVPKLDQEQIDQVETKLQVYLSDVTLDFPIEISVLITFTEKELGWTVPEAVLEELLQKLAAQQLVGVELRRKDKAEGLALTVTWADNTKLEAVLESKNEEPNNKKRKKDSDDPGGKEDSSSKKTDGKKESVTVESLLSMNSAKERENKKVLEEIQQLLSKPTAKEQSIVEKFRSQGGAQVKEFCQYGTKAECCKANNSPTHCKKLHFKKIIQKHTDESLGDCSFLNTCFHMDMCKFVHYEIDYSSQKALMPKAVVTKSSNHDAPILYPPQWVQCDVRYLDMKILGKFAVVMADPPWDIHMELPYGTMGDDEMRRMDVPSLQDHGFIFLWVTGRAMELGRECLRLWGYERVDELIWVKTNQLQRIIRTGRTGHWFNHGKEHCLVGRKGTPKNMNRGLDCDVIVAEVRATSHKPDEIYGIIERLSPGTRKIELFGRPHNVQPNWITLGNQVDGVRLLEPDVVKAFRNKYPDGNCVAPRNS